MSHADRPFTRPLAGVDHALGEGRARQPVELLDQLRERLDRLDRSHPSASTSSADGHEARGDEATPGQEDAALAADQAAIAGERAQASRPDRSLPPKDRMDGSRGDQQGAEGADAPPALRQPWQPPAAVESAAGDLVDDGHRRAVEAGLGPKGEPYRPWFADGPDAPWFVDPWFAE